MNAMVMAAGAGTRLRPLTHSIPKPMFPVGNRPVLAHTLELLRRHGITDVVLNLYHHPAMIRDYFLDGAAWGVRLRYSLEKRLMGTAGGVKRVERYLNGTFLVMSGDGLTDVDLSAVVRFHRRRRALGTMVLKRVDERLEYGVTVTDSHGRIKRFLEKPAWSEVFTSTVNTGIYVFEPRVFHYIPSRRPFDFGRELWPLLLRRGEPIYGVEPAGYWTDIGNLREYRKAQRDVLDGRVKVTLPGREIRPRIRVGEGTVIHPRVRLQGPCLIGEDCRLERGASVDPYTVIGNGCRVGEGAHVRDSILWDDVRVARNVTLANCIIGRGARIAENISAFEGTVLNVQ